MPYYNRGRNWGVESTSQRMLRIASKGWKLGRWQARDSQGANPVDTLISDFQPTEL